MKGTNKTKGKPDRHRSDSFFPKEADSSTIDIDRLDMAKSEHNKKSVWT